MAEEKPNRGNFNLPKKGMPKIARPDIRTTEFIDKNNNRIDDRDEGFSPIAGIKRDQLKDVTSFVDRKLGTVGKHRHSGVDSERIDPKDLLGFPIFTAVPTHNAAEGTLVLTDISNAYALYARIDQAWQALAQITPSTFYIPLYGNDNSAGGSWTTINSSKITLTDTDYTGFTLTFVTIVSVTSGNGDVRFRNLTDSTTIVSFNINASNVQTQSSEITLTSGTKNYEVQIDGSSGGTMFCYSSHIRLDRA